MTDILHMDSDDMVQKGYDWMLKAASQAHQGKVFNYVMQNKAVMPRTALRYAIEKMTPDYRAARIATAAVSAAFSGSTSSGLPPGK